MPPRQDSPPLRPMLWLVAMAVFMQMLDTTIVNTALPSMAASLGESPLRMQTVVISYALTVAMLIPASGWLAHPLVGNTLLVGLAMASFALVRAETPWYLLGLQFAGFGAVNSLQFTAMNTLALRDLDDELASSGNSLLSMVMMLAMSLGVAVAGGLLGAFGGASINPGRGDALAAFRWSFVCVGLVTMASAAIFAQLGPTHHIPESKVQEAAPA